MDSFPIPVLSGSGAANAIPARIWTFLGKLIYFLMISLQGNLVPVVLSVSLTFQDFIQKEFSFGIDRAWGNVPKVKINKLLSLVI